MVSKAEATENFCKGLSLALTEGKELPKPPDMTEILKIGERRNEKETDPEAILNSWSVTGHSQEMRAQMEADKWIIKDMSLQGHSLVVYAPPNTGKTLFTLFGLIEAVKSGEIEGSNIYYFNCIFCFYAWFWKPNCFTWWIYFWEMAGCFNCYYRIVLGCNFALCFFKLFLKRLNKR